MVTGGGDERAHARLAVSRAKGARRARVVREGGRGVSRELLFIEGTSEICVKSSGVYRRNQWNAVASCQNVDRPEPSHRTLIRITPRTIAA